MKRKKPPLIIRKKKIQKYNSSTSDSSPDSKCIVSKIPVFTEKEFLSVNGREESIIVINEETPKLNSSNSFRSAEDHSSFSFTENEINQLELEVSANLPNMGREWGEEILRSFAAMWPEKIGLAGEGNGSSKPFSSSSSSLPGRQPALVPASPGNAKKSLRNVSIMQDRQRSMAKILASKKVNIVLKRLRKRTENSRSLRFSKQSDRIDVPIGIEESLNSKCSLSKFRRKQPTCKTVQNSRDEKMPRLSFSDNEMKRYESQLSRRNIKFLDMCESINNLPFEHSVVEACDTKNHSGDTHRCYTKSSREAKERKKISRNTNSQIPTDVNARTSINVARNGFDSSVIYSRGGNGIFTVGERSKSSHIKKLLRQSQLLAVKKDAGFDQETPSHPYSATGPTENMGRQNETETGLPASILIREAEGYPSHVSSSEAACENVNEPKQKRSSQSTPQNVRVFVQDGSTASCKSKVGRKKAEKRGQKGSEREKSARAALPTMTGLSLPSCHNSPSLGKERILPHSHRLVNKRNDCEEVLDRNVNAKSPHVTSNRQIRRAKENSANLKVDNSNPRFKEYSQEKHKKPCSHETNHDSALYLRKKVKTESEGKVSAEGFQSQIEPVPLTWKVNVPEGNTCHSENLEEQPEILCTKAAKSNSQNKKLPENSVKNNSSQREKDTTSSTTIEEKTNKPTRKRKSRSSSLLDIQEQEANKTLLSYDSLSSRIPRSKVRLSLQQQDPKETRNISSDEASPCELLRLAQEPRTAPRNTEIVEKDNAQKNLLSSQQNCAVKNHSSSLLCSGMERNVVNTDKYFPNLLRSIHVNSRIINKIPSLTPEENEKQLFSMHKITADEGSKISRSSDAHRNFKNSEDTSTQFSGVELNWEVEDPLQKGISIEKVNPISKNPKNSASKETQLISQTNIKKLRRVGRPHLKKNSEKSQRNDSKAEGMLNRNSRRSEKLHEVVLYTLDDTGNISRTTIIGASKDITKKSPKSPLNLSDSMRESSRYQNVSECNTKSIPGVTSTSNLQNRLVSPAKMTSISSKLLANGKLEAAKRRLMFPDVSSFDTSSSNQSFEDIRVPVCEQHKEAAVDSFIRILTGKGTQTCVITCLSPEDGKQLQERKRDGSLENASSIAGKEKITKKPIISPCKDILLDGEIDERMKDQNTKDASRETSELVQSRNISHELDLFFTGNKKSAKLEFALPCDLGSKGNMSKSFIQPFPGVTKKCKGSFTSLVKTTNEKESRSKELGEASKEQVIQNVKEEFSETSFELDHEIQNICEHLDLLLSHDQKSVESESVVPCSSGIITNIGESFVEPVTEVTTKCKDFLKLPVKNTNEKELHSGEGTSEGKLRINPEDAFREIAHVLLEETNISSQLDFPLPELDKNIVQSEIAGPFISKSKTRTSESSNHLVPGVTNKCNVSLEFTEKSTSEQEPPTSRVKEAPQGAVWRVARFNSCANETTASHEDNAASAVMAEDLDHHSVSKLSNSSGTAVDRTTPNRSEGKVSHCLKQNVGGTASSLEAETDAPGAKLREDVGIVLMGGKSESPANKCRDEELISTNCDKSNTQNEAGMWESALCRKMNTGKIWRPLHMLSHAKRKEHRLSVQSLRKRQLKNKSIVNKLISMRAEDMTIRKFTHPSFQLAELTRIIRSSSSLRNRKIRSLFSFLKHLKQKKTVGRMKSLSVSNSVTKSGSNSYCSKVDNRSTQSPCALRNAEKTNLCNASRKITTAGRKRLFPINLNVCKHQRHFASIIVSTISRISRSPHLQKMKRKTLERSKKIVDSRRRRLRSSSEKVRTAVGSEVAPAADGSPRSPMGRGHKRKIAEDDEPPALSAHSDLNFYMEPDAADHRHSQRCSWEEPPQRAAEKDLFPHRSPVGTLIPNGGEEVSNAPSANRASVTSTQPGRVPSEGSALGASVPQRSSDGALSQLPVSKTAETSLEGAEENVHSLRKVDASTNTDVTSSSSAICGIYEIMFEANRCFESVKYFHQNLRNWIERLKYDTSLPPELMSQTLHSTFLKAHQDLRSPVLQQKPPGEDAVLNTCVTTAQMSKQINSSLNSGKRTYTNMALQSEQGCYGPKILENDNSLSSIFKHEKRKTGFGGRCLFNEGTRNAFQPPQNLGANGNIKIPSSTDLCSYPEEMTGKSPVAKGMSSTKLKKIGKEQRGGTLNTQHLDESKSVSNGRRKKMKPKTNQEKCYTKSEGHFRLKYAPNQGKNIMAARHLMENPKKSKSSRQGVRKERGNLKSKPFAELDERTAFEIREHLLLQAKNKYFPSVSAHSDRSQQNDPFFY